MANEITTTEAAAVIPEVWRRNVLKARYARQVVVPRVGNVTQDIQKMGDIVHIPTMPQTLSINDVGSGGSLTNQAITITDTTLTIDRWKETTVDITDRSVVQSIVDLFREFSISFGDILAEHLDEQLLAEHSNITTNAVGGDQTLDDDLMTDAIRLLDDIPVPEDDRSWVFAPIAKRDLMRLDKFVLANQTGMSKGLQINGNFGEIYGAPVLTSSKVATSGGQRKNLYFHREAIFIGIQRNIRFQKLAKTQLSQKLVADLLYGIKTVRENHAVVVSTSSS